MIHVTLALAGSARVAAEMFLNRLRSASHEMFVSSSVGGAPAEDAVSAMVSVAGGSGGGERGQEKTVVSCWLLR